MLIRMILLKQHELEITCIKHVQRVRRLHKRILPRVQARRGKPIVEERPAFLEAP
jgi:hypothetical protein